MANGVSSANHPQTNRLDERLNQTLVATLKKVVDACSNDWDETKRESVTHKIIHLSIFLLHGNPLGKLRVGLLALVTKDDDGSCKVFI